jgi:methionyl-tRNA synthetase
MSKSAGTGIDPVTMAQTYGVDQLRYYLLREVSFGQDGSYSHEAIVTRANADLANGLGNLAQRCLSMIAKNCGGVVPRADGPGEAGEALFTAIAAAEQAMRQAMEGLALHAALAAIWEAVSAANVYFAEQAPWTVRKTDPAQADQILYVAAEAVRRIAILTLWAIPKSSDALLDQLGQAPEARDFLALEEPLVAGTPLPPPQGVFPRWVEPVTP